MARRPGPRAVAKALLSARAALAAERRRQTRLRRRGPRRTGRPPMKRPERRATYWTHLGSPPQCQPAEHAAARTFLRRILDTIDRGGWSNAERVSLYRLRKTWQARAAGQDRRFELAGNRRGRLPRHLEDQLS